MQVKDEREGGPTCSPVTMAKHMELANGKFDGLGRSQLTSGGSNLACVLVL